MAFVIWFLFVCNVITAVIYCAWCILTPGRVRFDKYTEWEQEAVVYLDPAPEWGVQATKPTAVRRVKPSSPTSQAEGVQNSHPLFYPTQ